MKSIDPAFACAEAAIATFNPSGGLGSLRLTVPIAPVPSELSNDTSAQLYPNPPETTVTLTTVSSTTVAMADAPFPSPVIITVGVVVYPAPAVVIVIASTVPEQLKFVLDEKKRTGM